MPTFSVREYTSYVDEYRVIAATKQEALRLADQYRAWKQCPTTHESNPTAGTVEHVTQHAYLEHTDTCINELDANGNWITT